MKYESSTAVYEEDAEIPMSELTISIVICTHNGARTLQTALASVCNQTLDRTRYEVIVVDDASTDGSGEIAVRAGGRVVRREQSSGLAAARNAGLEVVETDLVVFTDDDCEPARDWLENLTAPFADPAIDGVTGLTSTASTARLEFRYLELRNPLRPLPARILTTKTPWQRLLNYVTSEIGPTPPIEPGAAVYNLVGANMALRRKHVVAVGGLDESFVTSSEEEELCVRIHEHLGGACFVYQPSAKVAHHYRPGFCDSLRRAKHYGHGSVIFSRHKGTTPIVYPFPVAIGALAGLVFARKVSPVLLLLSPLLAYGRWLMVLQQRGPETFLYPYMQFLQEIAFSYGEIRSLLGLSR